MTDADRMSPTLSLTPAERMKVRALARSDNYTLIGVALAAALDCCEDGDRLAARMLATIREARPCTP